MKVKTIIGLVAMAAMAAATAAPGDVSATLTLADGSIVKGRVATGEIVVESVLGELKIPVDKITRVELAPATATNAKLSAPAKPDEPQTETVNGVSFKYFVKNGEAEIASGVREVPAVARTTSGEVVIPERLGGCPVTSLGMDAFYGCSRITSVKIPDTVANIGYCCFFGCRSLQGGLVISDSVTNIEAQAFEHCSSLKTVKIGDNVPRMNSWVFYDCPKLESIEFGKGLDTIWDWAFDQDRSLTSLRLPENVRHIGEGSFNGCRSLAEVTVAGAVTNVGHRAFSGCPRLAPINWKKGVPPGFQQPVQRSFITED